MERTCINCFKRVGCSWYEVWGGPMDKNMIEEKGYNCCQEFSPEELKIVNKEW